MQSNEADCHSLLINLQKDTRAPHSILQIRPTQYSAFCLVDYSSGIGGKCSKALEGLAIVDPIGTLEVTSG